MGQSGKRQWCIPEVRFGVRAFIAGAGGAPRQQLLRHFHGGTLRRARPLSQQDFRSDEIHRETLARRQGGHKLWAAIALRTHTVYS